MTPHLNNHQRLLTKYPRAIISKIDYPMIIHRKSFEFSILMQIELDNQIKHVAGANLVRIMADRPI